MKQIVSASNITFSASGKTITFANQIPASLSSILHVTNVTRGVLYFQPQAGSAYTGTYASPVLTLACSTSGHSDTDKLEIFYDDEVSQAKETTLSSIDTKTPALVTGRVPVDGSGVTQPVSGTVTVSNMVSQGLTDAQIRATPLPVSGTVSTGLSQPLTDTQLRATPVPVSGTFWQATQPVSASSLPLPTGAATEATIGSILTELQSHATLADTQPVSAASLPLPTGASTEATLSSILTELQGKADLAETQPVSAASLPLPTGAATSANQTTANSSLSSVDGKLPSLSGGRIPVDGSGVTQPVSGTFWQATQPVSAASLPLPTGAATEATLSSIGTKIPSQGQAAAAASIPVVLCTEDKQDTYVAGAASQTATVNNILTNPSGTAATDTLGYRSFCIQVTSTASGGTFIFEGSNDNSNFVAIPVYNTSLVVRVPIVTAITATASNIHYEGACNFRYLRLRIASTITGGAIQALSVFSPQPFSSALQVVSNGTAANLLATVSATNLSCNVAQMNGVAVTMGNGVAGTGVQRVAIASDNTANSNPWLATLAASAAQGSGTNHHAISANTTNATNVKASAGTVHCLQVSNINAAFRYLKLYNKATSPTVGTDTPVMTIALPPNSNQFINVGPYGIRFATGIGYALTTGIAVADTGAVAASEHSIGIFYT